MMGLRIRIVLKKKQMPTKGAALRRSALSAAGHLSATPGEARLTELEFVFPVADLELAHELFSKSMYTSPSTTETG